MSSTKLAGLCRALIAKISPFEPVHSYKDQDWKFFLKPKRSWRILSVKEYEGVFYFWSSEFEQFSFDSKMNKLAEVRYEPDVAEILPHFIAALKTTHASVKKDAADYHRYLLRSLSPGVRKGLIHRRFVRELIPTWMRYDKALGPSAVTAAIELLESNRFNDDLLSMNAEKFFEYCRVAYLANSENFAGNFDSSLSGRDMYKRWADGRDGGLTGIDPTSTELFCEWFESKAWSGGHPWEIYRGGNTTHIDLYVEKSGGKWRVHLSAFSSTRLAETCRIALAFAQANLPFTLEHRQSYLKRLRCDDLIGIIPEFDTVHRGWQQFPQEFEIADCIQFSWFKREDGSWPSPSRAIADLATWLPERPLLLRRKRG